MNLKQQIDANRKSSMAGLDVPWLLGLVEECAVVAQRHDTLENVAKNELRARLEPSEALASEAS